MSQKLRWMFATLLGGLALDQATKWWVMLNLRYRGPLELPLPRVDGPTDIPLIPHFLSIVHAQNPGAAFGSFGDWEYRLVLVYSFLVVATLIVLDFWRRLPPTDRFLPAVLGIILSGAWGNAIDRFHKGTVTDFIRFYTDNPEWARWLREGPLGAAEWPAFNVADSALFVGIGLFLVHYLFLDDEEDDEKSPPAPV